MLLLKATLLWSMALAGAALLRNAHAVDRHRLWTIGFAAVLLLPVLTAILPSLDVPVPSWAAARTDHDGRAGAPSTAAPNDAIKLTHLDAAMAAPGDADSTPASSSTSDSIPSGGTLSWPSLRSMLLAAWAIGTGAAVAMILLSLARVNRLAHLGEELDDGRWREMAASLALRFGVTRRVRLIVDPSVTTPMAGGLWQPVIFLPPEATSWSAEQSAIVLAHEIAHLRGRDPLRLVAARLAVALYWFHPLAWLAARQSSIVREQACDAAVLALGTRPSDYARVLLDFAESMAPPSQPLAALPIVEPSLLEIRLVEILKGDRGQAPRSRVLVSLVVAAAATLTVAVARPLAMAVPAVPATASSPATPVSSPSASATASGHAAESPSAPMPQPVRRNAGCWTSDDGTSFSGTITTNGSVVTRQIGSRGGDRIIQDTLGGLRVCMVAENVGEGNEDAIPSTWIGHADRIVMETRQGGSVQRLTLEGPDAQRVSWTVNGTDRPFDAAARQWRDRMLALLDLSWQISSIHGHVSSLRGEISSVRGEESSLRGDISSLRGEVSSMRGRQSSVRGDESSLRGEISSIRGHVSSLRGEISSEQGAISSLNATRDDADASERARIDASITRHEDNIKRIERELADYNEDAKIADVEKQIQTLDADAKVRAIDEEIRQFDLDGKVAKINQQIKDLDVDGKVAAIEKQIDSLDADRKVRELESRRDKARDDLQAAVSKLR
jgi:beta-lactamase regulating signal transducer with metallopeptidase domain